MELLTIQNLCKILNCSPTSLWRKRKAGKFPEPVESMLPSLRWRKEVIEHWLRKS